MEVAVIENFNDENFGFWQINNIWNGIIYRYIDNFEKFWLG